MSDPTPKTAFLYEGLWMVTERPLTPSEMGRLERLIEQALPCAGHLFTTTVPPEEVDAKTWGVDETNRVGLHHGCVSIEDRKS